MDSFREEVSDPSMDETGVLKSPKRISFDTIITARGCRQPLASVSNCLLSLKSSAQLHV